MSGTAVIPLAEIHRFIKDCFVALGAPVAHADAVAVAITDADYTGHFCHGMNRLEMYIKEIQHGICNVSAVPKILKETPAVAWVDGMNGLGVIVGNFCMDLAIHKAKTMGIGWVVAKGSNRNGIAGSFSLRASKEGLVGLSFSNGAPMVSPTRAVAAALGTNPLSMAAPATKDDTFLLDMATSAVAAGKIEMLSRQHLPVPEDWANLKTGVLRPLGGKEPNSNYKGFGLSMMVEVLCGILGGGAYGPRIRKYGDYGQEANLGQCFAAIDPNFFAPGFGDRLSDLMDYIRNMEPADAEKPVIVPGDLERQHMANVDREGGVRYLKDQLITCEKYANGLNVRALQPLEE